ncbi:unnamed protein product [Rhodiola kirilowii]
MKNKSATSVIVSGSKRRLGEALREQRAKLYIIKRCVVMLLCWRD